MGIEEYAQRFLEQDELGDVSEVEATMAGKAKSKDKKKEPGTFPEKADVIFTLTRIYQGHALNCARSIEHNLVVRTVVRNSGLDKKADDSSDSDSDSDSDSEAESEAAAAGDDKLDDVDLEISFPSPADLYKSVWGLIPDFIKDKIREWAKNGMEQQIAREITNYVKMALGALPIPVPSIFINAVANLVIPPLVTYIINLLVGSAAAAETATGGKDLGASYNLTPSTLRLTKNLDRDILQLAGLSVIDLPAHLRWTGDARSSKEISSLSSDSNNPTSLGQPDNRDSRVAMKRFYDLTNPNGCHPMDLAQLVDAQIRTNPMSDQEPNKFAQNVWDTLSKKEQDDLLAWAKKSTPDKSQMAESLYKPVCKLLGQDPYNVPRNIRPTFTSMKVPEVVEWIITTKPKAKKST